MKIGSEKGFIGLLGMVIALAIASYLFYMILNSYFKMPQVKSTIATQETSSRTNTSTYIDTSSKQNIEQSVRKQIDEVESKHFKAMDDLEKQLR